jgi:hypothetical protein
MEYTINDFWELFSTGRRYKKITLFISGTFVALSKNQFLNMSNTPFMFGGQEFRKDNDTIKRVK